MSNSIPDLLTNASERFWFSAEELARIFGITERTVEDHIANLFDEGERNKETDVRFLTAIDDEGELTKVPYYSLDALLSIGLRVGGEKGKRFRQWAFQNLSEYVVKGFVLDDERLKNPDGESDYFDELRDATQEN